MAGGRASRSPSPRVRSLLRQGPPHPSYTPRLSVSSEDPAGQPCNWAYSFRISQPEAARQMALAIRSPANWENDHTGRHAEDGEEAYRCGPEHRGAFLIANPKGILRRWHPQTSQRSIRIAGSYSLPRWTYRPRLPAGGNRTSLSSPTESFQASPTISFEIEDREHPSQYPISNAGPASRNR